MSAQWWEIAKAHKYAELMFAYHQAESEFTDALVEAAGDESAQDAWEYGRISGDYYDGSIEIYEVGNDVRLNEAHQRLVFDAGFSRIWLNHKDGMETYYAWGPEFAWMNGHRKLGHRAQMATEQPATPGVNPTAPPQRDS